MRGDVQDGWGVQLFEGGFGSTFFGQYCSVRQLGVDERGFLGCAFERRVAELCEINAAILYFSFGYRVLLVRGVGILGAERQSASGLSALACGDRLARQVVGRVGEYNSARTLSPLT